MFTSYLADIQSVHKIYNFINLDRPKKKKNRKEERRRREKKTGKIKNKYQSLKNLIISTTSADARARLSLIQLFRFYVFFLFSSFVLLFDKIKIVNFCFCRRRVSILSHRLSLALIKFVAIVYCVM